MIDQFVPEHHIQKSIIDVLMHKKYARFRDMRPGDVDTNLYSYHLKLLQKRGFVKKASEGYTLDEQGLLFVDRVSTKSLKIRTQPKIITMLVVQNSNGDILLFKRKRQPYADLWTLPYGKLHIDDVSVIAAAQRECSEKIGLTGVSPRHVGDCYIRIVDGEQVMMSTLVHVCAFNTDDIAETDTLVWARPHKLANYALAPAVEAIMSRTFFGDDFFFEEFEEAWSGV